MYLWRPRSILEVMFLTMLTYRGKKQYYVIPDQLNSFSIFIFIFCLVSMSSNTEVLSRFKIFLLFLSRIFFVGKQISFQNEYYHKNTCCSLITNNIIKQIMPLSNDFGKGTSSSWSNWINGVKKILEMIINTDLLSMNKSLNF